MLKIYCVCGCGKFFEPRNFDKKYASRKCALKIYQREWRGRKKNKLKKITAGIEAWTKYKSTTS